MILAVTCNQQRNAALHAQSLSLSLKPCSVGMAHSHSQSGSASENGSLLPHQHMHVSIPLGALHHCVCTRGLQAMAAFVFVGRPCDSWYQAVPVLGLPDLVRVWMARRVCVLG